MKTTEVLRQQVQSVLLFGLLASTLALKTSHTHGQQGKRKSKDDMGARATKDPPIHVACRTGDPKAVQAIIDDAGDGAVAFLDALDRNGESPLALAINGSFAETTTVLLKAGAQINGPDNDGFTPMDYAMCACRYDVAKLLSTASGTKGRRNGSTCELHKARCNQVWQAQICWNSSWQERT